MKLTNYGIVCPACKHEITIKNDLIFCQFCQMKFPVLHGIIDLRFPQMEDGTAVNTMKTYYDQSSFDELLSIMLSDYHLSQKMLNDTLAYYSNQVDRTEQMTDMFIKSIERAFGSPKPDRALDLGCGSGAGILALSQFFNQVIGLDASMKQLLLAKKNLEKFHIKDYILICGFANCLPFKNQSFTYIQAMNVFEHVMVIAPVIQEISRTLTIGGEFSADSRNRFDIFFPEPHTGIRLLGFLPRKVTPKIVKWYNRSSYEQTRLLSFQELKKALNYSFQGNFNIEFPNVLAYNQPHWINRIISVVEKIPLISKIAIQVFPTHIVIGKKLEGNL
ncbi:MAG: class I SAM-dependent methyltransferase [Pseudomonadota bacterium]|nr:class I SAM-dependent methyltransferase [Pseudomonadota bacterium]